MFLRGAICILLAGALLAGLTTAVQGDYGSTWKALWKRLRQGSESPREINQFKARLLDYANNGRTAGSGQQAPLRFDLEIENWLQAEIDNGLDLRNMEAVAAQVQQQWPRYLRLHLASATGPTLDQIAEKLCEHLNQPDGRMTHLGCALRSSAGGIASQALLLTGERLRDFSPELLQTSVDESFFHRCPHCQTEHISRIQNHHESSTLECPSCLRAYAVIAADSRGQFHYVNEYLTGYQPPAVYPAGQSKLEQLFTIWSAVHQNCRYQRDPGANKARTDRWQTAVETQSIGVGDCEDSAIYLADWLIARGYEARVALGKYGDIGGHAWVVVRLDGQEYLLESTAEGNPDFDQPPLVSRVGSRYVPDVLFDRWSIHVRATPKQAWGGDYWSEETWLRLEPRKQTRQEKLVAKKPVPSPVSAEQRPRNDSNSTSKIAFIQHADLKAAPFLQPDQPADDWDGSWRAPAAAEGEPGTGEDAGGTPGDASRR